MASFLQVFPPKCCRYFSPMCGMCPTNFILLDLIILTMFCEEYKPCSSSVCHFLQPPLTSSLIGSNVFNILLLNKVILKAHSSVNVTKFHTHTKQQAKYNTTATTKYEPQYLLECVT